MRCGIFAPACGVKSSSMNLLHRDPTEIAGREAHSSLESRALLTGAFAIPLSRQRLHTTGRKVRILLRKYLRGALSSHQCIESASPIKTTQGCKSQLCAVCLQSPQTPVRPKVLHNAPDFLLTLQRITRPFQHVSL